MTSPHEQTVLPLQDNDLLEAIRALLESDGHVALLADNGQPLELPERLRAVLRDVVGAMHRGQAITLAPVGQRLTTQEAADLLGISRPTLIKLLEAGKIPYETPGRHRRIRLTDLLAYQAVRREEQRRILQDITERRKRPGFMTNRRRSTSGRSMKHVRSSPDCLRGAARLVRSGTECAL